MMLVQKFVIWKKLILASDQEVYLEEILFPKYHIALEKLNDQ